ncbi:O-succinylbenzoic acid--CoA ligase [Agromyces luteolus]|uniref:AMP-binding protein n=1 Tax=Agromyces luteolus TaxID=88373 RepID=A0A7C9HLE8_9MICO|nr:AMP-binding protein [Agromyces luteolus]MUN07442.1 AMP-binding protein [Agromyces luteolus]GLK29477.1 O-succinylbenzoic acid--CoA ligase [Agromyces luteolus]
MKPLIRVAAGDVPRLIAQLREAVLLDGLAVLPIPGEIEPADPIEALVHDEVAVVVETSGSTDRPKRVALSGAALRASAGATSGWFGGVHGQWVLALPGTYIAGIQVLVRSLVAGTEPAVVPAGGFTPEAFVEAARTLDPDRPWFTSLVPVQLSRLVEAADADRSVRAALGSFEAILLGGQAAPAGLVERAAALGARVHRTYGSSETAGGCVYDGRPLNGVDVRIVDGEVQLAGRMLAEGYLDDPERTARAFAVDADGRRWYRTGDLGSIADDGRLRITGRADDVMISGGVKVVLGEVERAVHGVEGFADAMVVAVPDAEWGERAAVVSAAAAARAEGALEVLRAATDAAGLPPAGRPVRLVVVGDLPRLASGKPDRVAASALARGADGA